MWKEHGLDPKWVEAIPFYEYQIWIDKLNLHIEKENKQTMEDSGQVEVFNFRK